MISLAVRATSGHYRVPGQVEQGSVQSTFPIAPPSCIRGFLESMCGTPQGSFRGAFAYGYLRPPEGHGLLVRRAHVYSSSGIKGEARGALAETIRVVKVDTLFDLSYRVDVRGSWEARVRAALAGDVARFGVLSLGESTDLVTWLDECPSDTPAQWVVPGSRMALPVRSGRGFDTVSAEYATFDFGTAPSWFSVEAS